MKAPTNDLIRLTAREVKVARNYGGVCNVCGGVVGRAGDMAVVELEEDDLGWRCVPIDAFECPHCSSTVKTIRLWKSMDVTNELAVKV